MSLRGRAALLGGLLLCAACTPVDDETALSERAQRLHARVLTLDSHVDVPSTMLRPEFDITRRHDWLRDLSQVDLPRLREGGLDAAFFIVFLPQGPLDDSGYQASRQRVDAMFERIDALASAPDSEFQRALAADDAERIAKAGKIAVYIGIENGYPLGEDLDLLETYYARGARYVTLAHFANNQIADSATDPDGADWNGLSPFGESVVAEMNRLGMMVDISHTSDETFWDVIEMTTAPIIASHSGVFAVYGHPRNMKDDMLQALADNGGVVQINGFSSYLADLEQPPQRLAALAALSERYGNWWRLPPDQQVEARAALGEINAAHPPAQANLADVADHIDHAVKLIGVDHVGISMDFDGGGGVHGVAHVGEMGNLTLELLRRGYRDTDVEKIWSGNLLRVMAAVEARAEP